MARIRTIKPEFWKHEGLSNLPEATILLAVALLNYADDEGYFNANPKLIAAECCPLREPSVPIPVSLTELSNVGYLELGTGVGERCYGHILNFTEHQVINKPKASKIKDLEIDWDASGIATVALPEQSRQEQGTGKGTGKGNREHETREIAREFHETFWPEYPNKTAKPKALQSFRSTRKKHALEAIMDGLRRYVATKPATRDWLNPATFLNQERFLDEPAPVATAPPQLSRTQHAIEKLRQRNGTSSRPELCNRGGELPPEIIPPTGARPGGFREPAHHPLHGAAKGGVAEDGEPD